MQIREWVNKNSAVTTIIALVMLFLALYYLVITIFPPPPKPITKVWFYDVVSGELFEGPVNELPPIETPKGNRISPESTAGVKANVFSCGRCRESEWYIGYLEMYLPAAKRKQEEMNEQARKMMEAPPPSPEGQPGAGTPPPPMPMMGPSPQEMMIISQGHLVATKEAVDKWFPQESPEGAQLVNEAMKKCPDNKYPQQCFPGR